MCSKVLANFNFRRNCNYHNFDCAHNLDTTYTTYQLGQFGHNLPTHPPFLWLSAAKRAVQVLPWLEHDQPWLEHVSNVGCCSWKPRLPALPFSAAYRLMAVQSLGAYKVDHFLFWVHTTQRAQAKAFCLAFPHTRASRIHTLYTNTSKLNLACAFGVSLTQWWCHWAGQYNDSVYVITVQCILTSIIIAQLKFYWQHPWEQSPSCVHGIRWNQRLIWCTVYLVKRRHIAMFMQLCR